jgi:hypothetical protein
LPRPDLTVGGIRLILHADRLILYFITASVHLFLVFRKKSIFAVYPPRIGALPSLSLSMSRLSSSAAVFLLVRSLAAAPAWDCGLPRGPVQIVLNGATGAPTLLKLAGGAVPLAAGGGFSVADYNASPDISGGGAVEIVATGGRCQLRLRLEPDNARVLQLGHG